jgi:hypothetical protein
VWQITRSHLRFQARVLMQQLGLLERPAQRLRGAP